MILYYQGREETEKEKKDSYDQVLGHSDILKLDRYAQEPKYKERSDLRRESWSSGSLAANSKKELKFTSL